jgi:hypothetical protein
MTPNDKLAEINQQLRGKRPVAAKAPAIANSKLDVATLRKRIADVRKQIGIAFEQAEKLGATKLVAQIRALSQQLVELESALAQISGVKGRLVRMIKT